MTYVDVDCVVYSGCGTPSTVNISFGTSKCIDSVQWAWGTQQYMRVPASASYKMHAVLFRQGKLVKCFRNLLVSAAALLLRLERVFHVWSQLTRQAVSTSEI